MALLYMPLSAVLALGLGPWGGWGIAGPAVASTVTTVIAVILQGRALITGRLGFAPTFAGVRLQRRLFGEILSVGLMGSMTTITASATRGLSVGAKASYSEWSRRYSSTLDATYFSFWRSPTAWAVPVLPPLA